MNNDTKQDGANNGVGSTSGSAFDRAQWEEAPECRRCHAAMSLNAGCEWPDDDRALLCGACATVALEEALAQLTSPNHSGQRRGAAAFSVAAGSTFFMPTHHDYDADGTIASEMLDEQEHQRERDRLGRIVREVWIAWAKEQEAPKPSWLVPYDQLNEPDKEVDRRIGERLFWEGSKARFASQGYRSPGKSNSPAQPPKVG